MAPMTRRFMESIEAFAKREGIELITFKRHERKEDVARRYLAEFSGQEAVLFIGKAQEQATVIRTERRHNLKFSEDLQSKR
jgi:ribosomal protein S2